MVDCRDGCHGWECTRDGVHYRGEGCGEDQDPCGRGKGNFLKNVSLYHKSLIETFELINFRSMNSKVDAATPMDSMIQRWMSSNLFQ